MHFTDFSGPKSVSIKEFGTTGIKQLLPAVLSTHLADQRTLKDALYAKFVRNVDATDGPQVRVVVKQSNGTNLVIKTAAVTKSPCSTAQRRWRPTSTATSRTSSPSSRCATLRRLSSKTSRRHTPTPTPNRHCSIRRRRQPGNPEREREPPHLCTRRTPAAAHASLECVAGSSCICRL